MGSPGKVKPAPQMKQDRQITDIDTEKGVGRYRESRKGYKRKKGIIANRRLGRGSLGAWQEQPYRLES